MASVTRQVLDYFEQSPEAISMAALARQLQIAPAILQGILDYWVQKGKLREVAINTDTCNSCGIKTACPFVMTMPRYYECVGQAVSQSVCDCQGKCKQQ